MGEKEMFGQAGLVWPMVICLGVVGGFVWLVMRQNRLASVIETERQAGRAANLVSADPLKVELNGVVYPAQWDTGHETEAQPNATVSLIGFRGKTAVVRSTTAAIRG